MQGRSEDLGMAGIRRTACTGDGLDEDLHRVFALGAARADAGDAGGATHDGERWRDVERLRWRSG